MSEKSRIQVGTSSYLVSLHHHADSGVHHMALSTVSDCNSSKDGVAKRGIEVPMRTRSFRPPPSLFSIEREATVTAKKQIPEKHHNTSFDSDFQTR